MLCALVTEIYMKMPFWVRSAVHLVHNLISSSGTVGNIALPERLMPCTSSSIFFQCRELKCTIWDCHIPLYKTKITAKEILHRETCLFSVHHALQALTIAAIEMLHLLCTWMANIHQFPLEPLYGPVVYLYVPANAAYFPACLGSRFPKLIAHWAKKCILHSA